MAPRTAFLLLGLLAAVICFQGVVVADEATTNVAGLVDVNLSSEAGFGTSLGVERNSEKFPEAEVDEAEFDSSTSSTEGDDSSTEVATGEGESEEDLSPAHPLSRILSERSSKRCWSKKHCKKHFKKPGCCKKKCVNLASDNKNCGKCGKCCDTKKGYCCQSGKCRKIKKKAHRKPHKPVKHDEDKPHKPHRGSMCGYHKKCKKGYTCCKGKCVHLKSNNGHCGKCGKGCGYGSACCKGKCVNLKHDSRNCGKCGRSCGYGRKCCNGCCKNVFGNDKHNCGACGKKCSTKCEYGMCGYGH